MIALIFFLTLTWSDNSTNEQGFYILRKAPGASTYVLIATVGPNVQRYRDQKPKRWEQWCYLVAAYNAIGRSYSNEYCANS
jgi:hypothetical protein